MFSFGYDVTLYGLLEVVDKGLAGHFGFAALE